MELVQDSDNCFDIVAGVREGDTERLPLVTLSVADGDDEVD